MAIVDGLDDDRLLMLEQRFRDRLMKQTDARGRWIWSGNLLEVRFCRMADLEPALLDHANDGFEVLRIDDEPTRRPVTLFKLWRVVWQTQSPDLLARAAEATDQMDSAWWESKLYADFIRRGSLPMFGPPPVRDLGAALVLSREQAVGLVEHRVRRSIEVAQRAPDIGRATAALGPLSWARGVVWARRAMDGVDVVPSGLERLFYGANLTSLPHLRGD